MVNTADFYRRLGALLAACLLTCTANASDQQPFDFAWLKGHARHLAQRSYTPPETQLPQPVQQLSWDDYQQLQFKTEQALWYGTDSRLRAEFFHLGLFFKTPVKIHRLDSDQSHPVPYSAGMFNYGDSGIAGTDLPSDLGFAGFRFKFHTDWSRDVIAFLGASYFRAVGSAMQYGLSARGLAIDTALPRAEEFPMFTHFWLQRPTGDSATVYALLDSPSISGAYRFTITPGEPLTIRVDSALYPRQAIERLGIAPLTSMYQHGENDRRMAYDWRPEIHDSDGLAMHTGSGEWIWRPLSNPEKLQFNSYQDNNPRGFGLLQRDRNFDHYQDDGVFYDRRPSLWIEPDDNWGPGWVQLVEIPTVDETFDNIVAFWHPQQPIAAGQELLYSYTMHWGSAPPVRSGKAKVVDTFTGLGGVIGQKRQYYSKRFAIDFRGGQLPMLAAEAEVKAIISVSAGDIEIASARPQKAINGYRAMFDLVPPENRLEPINIRLHLALDGKKLSETWSYQWAPPPLSERQLYNP